MTDEKRIAREWIEIREDSDEDRLVFRPSDFPVPPARGRRHLNLSQEGQGSSRGPGATDKLELKSEGGWGVKQNSLSLKIPGWEGEYMIEDLQDDILVLKKSPE